MAPGMPSSNAARTAPWCTQFYDGTISAQPSCAATPCSCDRERCVVTELAGMRTTSRSTSTVRTSSRSVKGSQCSSRSPISEPSGCRPRQPRHALLGGKRYGTAAGVLMRCPLRCSPASSLRGVRPRQSKAVNTLWAHNDLRDGGARPTGRSMSERTVRYIRRALRSRLDRRHWSRSRRWRTVEHGCRAPQFEWISQTGTPSDVIAGSVASRVSLGRSQRLWVRCRGQRRIELSPAFVSSARRCSSCRQPIRPLRRHRYRGCPARAVVGVWVGCLRLSPDDARRGPRGRA